MGLVRIFLALVVVVDHWRVIILTPREAPYVDQAVELGFNGGYAVMFFFVISGFLITYTLSRNYSRDFQGDLRFYGNRFVRIFSLFWPLVIVAFLIVPHAWERFAASSAADEFFAIFLIGFDWWMWIVRNPYILGLSSAWTLGPELFFYLVAPLLMRSWKTGFAALVFFLGVRLAFVVANGPAFQGLWTYMFAPSSYGFFLLGHAVCLASARFGWLESGIFGVALLTVSFGTMTFAPMGPFDGPRFWVSILCFTLALPGLFLATKDIRWMNRLGDLSYTVYLVHGIVIAVAGETLANALPLASPYVSVAAVLALVLAASVVAHWAIEKPVARAMRWTAAYFTRPVSLQSLTAAIKR